MNEELKAKMNELENQNSINAEKHADRAFKSFLAYANAPSDEYHLFEEAELDKWLAKFWYGARTSNDELYSVNLLKSFKYGLKRDLQKIGHAYDITKDTAFKESLLYIY